MVRATVRMIQVDAGVAAFEEGAPSPEALCGLFRSLSSSD
jgi:hypothetical protein